jgi:hypothetical protein
LMHYVLKIICEGNIVCSFCTMYTVLIWTMMQSQSIISETKITEVLQKQSAYFIMFDLWICRCLQGFWIW